MSSDRRVLLLCHAKLCDAVLSCCAPASVKHSHPHCKIEAAVQQLPALLAHIHLITGGAAVQGVQKVGMGWQVSGGLGLVGSGSVGASSDAEAGRLVEESEIGRELQKGAWTSLTATSEGCQPEDSFLFNLQSPPTQPAPPGITHSTH